MSMEIQISMYGLTRILISPISEASDNESSTLRLVQIAVVLGCVYTTGEGGRVTMLEASEFASEFRAPPALNLTLATCLQSIVFTDK